MERRENKKKVVPHINIGTLNHKDHSKEELNEFIKSQLDKMQNSNGKEER